MSKALELNESLRTGKYHIKSAPKPEVPNMSTLSPQLLPKFTWKPEDDMIDKLYYNYETSSSYNIQGTYSSIQSLSASPPQPDIDVNSACHLNSNKKLSHNAYERDRRKKLNNLYCSLRSLLPDSNQNKKLSIPTTISHVVKYIPELQKSVEKLRRRKEEILLRASRNGDTTNLLGGSLVYPVISVTGLDKNEVIIQICITSKATMLPLSEFLKVLEKEGLQLINASTFTTQDDKTFYSLHLQAKDSVNILVEYLCELLTKSLNEQGKLSPTPKFLCK